MNIRLIELFAGYGSQAMALERLQIPFEHYKVVEFDKYAINSYNAVHGTDFETTDIKDVTDLEIVDTDKFTYVLTYSFPCTDLSLAGKRKGMKRGSGTRSGLLWEVERILKNSKELPQVMLMENVPEVIGKDNEQDFNEWKMFLENLGYKNQVQIINAKDANIPQNRKRCFMISTIGYDNYIMPTSDYLKDKYKNKEKLVVQQLLELNVEEKYYVNNERASTLTTRYYKGIGANGDNIVCVGNINPSGNGLNGNVYSGNIIPTLTTNKGEGPKILTQTICASRGRNKENPNDRTPGAELEQRIEINQEDMSNTLTTVQKDNMVLQQILFKSRSDEPFRTFENGTCGTLRTIDSCGDKRVLVKQATQQGFIGCEVGGVADLSYPDSNTRRGRVIDNGNTSPTLTCNDSSVYKIETEYRIRKLTPRECGRLMDVSEEDISKMIEVNSNTQLYKQFGNSIVVKVLEELFISLFIENHMDTYIPLGRDGIDGQMSVFDL